MNKTNLPIYFAIAVIFGMLIGSFLGGDTSSQFIGKSSASEQKVKRLINYIDNNYVDNVNTDKLLDGAITQMLDKLDPHSVYIPKEQLQAVTENMQGNFVGIGVQFRMIGDTITVIQPIKGGPSIKVGIKAGDRILMANKDTLFGKNLRNNKILKTLKGEPNTKVDLTIYRKTNDSIFNTTVTRGKVNIKSVDIGYMLNDSIGYIKLDRFARNTYREFKKSLMDLKKQGMTDLVLDLRGNGGGFIDIANDIIDEFLEDEKLMVYTKNNKGYINESFATAKGDFEEGGLYVLIDENSASASEIVAGALQDNDKGTIIGRRSFGKGLVQQEMDLGDGSAVRLTTARYYTPTGRSIQKPYKKDKATNDVDAILGHPNALSQSTQYDNELDNRYKNGELFSKDSIHVVDSLKFTTPKGKVVYGGGGIIPDVFVAVDTSEYIPTIFFGKLNRFTFNYVDSNRKKLSTLTLEEFITNFDKDHKVSNEFLKDFKQFKLSKATEKQLRRNIKILIARELFDDEGMYKLQHQTDKMIQKVLELEANTKLTPQNF